MDLVHMDDKDSRLGGQNSNSFDGGVLDQLFSHQEVKFDKIPGYLCGETDGWTMNQGMAG